MMNADGELILAIASDNRTLHVGPVDELTAHVSLQQKGFTKVSSPATFEYYDAAGQPWIPSVDQTRRVCLTQQLAPPADPQFLLDRIDAALAHMQVVLNQHPEVGRPIQPRVPRPSGDLPKVLEVLAIEFVPLSGHSTAGNWLHRLSHLAGTAH